MNAREYLSFSLARLIDESVKTYHERALAAGINISIVHDSVFDIQLMSDLHKLKNLFGLVIQNAIDHSGASAITFSARQLLYFENHVLLEFCLTDNGKSANRSFAYYRSLVKIRHLVEEMHGKIESMNVPGFSSNLKFIIKCKWRHTEEMLTILKGNSSGSKLKGCRILVADPNEINQLLLKQVLQKEGAVVDVAGSGIETIHMLEKLSFDLLFIELNMPHMDGFQVANYIRKKLHNHLPMIALSSMDDSLEMHVQCRGIGFMQLLKKPIEPEFGEILWFYERSTIKMAHHFLPIKVSSMNDKEGIC